MSWNNQGGGGGPWGKGGGGGGPWGQGPSGSGGGQNGGGGGGGNQNADLEEILKRSQDKLKQAMPGGGGSRLLTTFVVLLGLAALSFYAFTVRVNPDQLGVVLRFGEWHRDLGPGLRFRYPFPVEQVFLPSVTQVNRVEVGILSGADSRFGGAQRDVPEESLMLTGDENIVDVDFVVFWQISDAKNFLFNIQNPEKTIKEVAESSMREIIGKSDIQPILTQDRAATEAAVRELIQTTLNEYGSGVFITNVQLQKVDPPQQVIDAFRDVQAARADQERLQNQAQAYANRVVPEARGSAERIIQQAEAYKAQIVQEAEGQAARFTSVYDEYKVAPEVTRQRIFLETMERVFEDTDKIIIDSGAGQGVVPYLPLDQLNNRRPGQTTGQSGQQGGRQ